ncbi:hypothetical protein FJY71_03560 [candidate division WOR-3 bacterium]|nr:hypothetical protein [candidate division WOR-3 bacterium]
MRRIVLVVALVAIVGFAAWMLLKPKPARRPSRRATSSDTSGTAAQPGSARQAGRGAAGRTSGRLRATTKAERTAERKRLREERRRQRREARRRERERKRALRYARKRGSTRKRSRKGQYYVLKATIVAPGAERFALIDSRRVGVGDVVMGRRVVSISENSIEVESFGRVITVRIGESLLPPSAATGRRRRG